MDFSNKTVLITGGARGIGRATAIAFAAKGAKVGINFRSNNYAARETIGLLEGDGHIALKSDISNPEAVEEMVHTFIQEFGRIDILVNNAGIHEEHPVDEIDYENWQRIWRETLDVNLFGAANVCYQAIQQMIQQDMGKIINISSRGAFRGEPLQLAYGASKAGLNSLGQSLAQAVGKHNIFVHTIAPGFVETDLTADKLNGPLGKGIKSQSPLNRVAKAEEIAHTVLMLAQAESNFLTGGIIDVNGASYLRS